MRIRALIPLGLLLLALWGSATPTVAQDSKTACDPASIIKKANALTAKGDSKADMEALQKLADDIHAQSIACNGLTFTGNNSKLIGPFDLPKGNFKAILTTRARFTGRLSAITGTCMTTRSTNSSGAATLFSVTGSDALNGSEAIIRSEGCHAVIETDGVRAAYKLTIEPLESTDPSLK
jgi:hypothetical protein